MTYNSEEIKKGIKLHKINTDKFKTTISAVFITTPLSKETVTKNALITAILRRGTKNYKTMEEISIELENMYGASFDCGVEKNGDNQVLKFYIESINDKYADEDLLKRSTNILLDIILNPLIENNGFNIDYLVQEKENLKDIIESKIDDKEQYALDRCAEEMYKNEPFGLYRYGYVRDLKEINEKNLYEQYIKLIDEAKIDIFISGEFENDNVNEIINNNEYINKLNERNISIRTSKMFTYKK